MKIRIGQKLTLKQLDKIVRGSALPIEVAAILLVYFWYGIKSKGTFSIHSR